MQVSDAHLSKPYPKLAQEMIIHDISQSKMVIKAWASNVKILIIYGYVSHSLFQIEPFKLHD